MTDLVYLLRGDPSDSLKHAAADEIVRLRRRIRVLEQVIAEEVDVMACRDSANQMIVEMILKQRASAQ